MWDHFTTSHLHMLMPWGQPTACRRGKIYITDMFCADRADQTQVFPVSAFVLEGPLTGPHPSLYRRYICYAKVLQTCQSSISRNSVDAEKLNDVFLDRMCYGQCTFDLSVVRSQTKLSPRMLVNGKPALWEKVCGVEQSLKHD